MDCRTFISFKCEFVVKSDTKTKTVSVPCKEEILKGLSTCGRFLVRKQNKIKKIHLV